MCENNVDVQPDELGGDLRETLTAPLGPAALDGDIAALEPAELA
jgi:hypothetical protein